MQRRADALPGPDRATGEAPSLGESVYLALCQELVKGHFQPDDRLRIRELAERLGTSVTPVRDAVLRLVQDRALVMRSARDIRVPTLTRSEYVEIRTIRMNLEGLAAETAASHVNDAFVDELQDLIARTRAAFDAGDRELATELNQVFHFRIAEVAQMPVLRGILQRLWLQLGPLIAEMTPAVGPEVIEWHRVLVEALSRGDGPAAAAAIRKDICENDAPILARIDRLEAEARQILTPPTART
jgi:DNA-binding GntR family transcriptional regulator